VADRIPEALKVNIQQLMSVLIPRFARQDTYAVELDRRLNLTAAVAACALLLFAFTIVPWLIPFLYTNAYCDAVLYCQLILISIAISAFAIVKNAYLSAKLDLPAMRSISLWTSSVRIVSSAILVWRFGALGAAVSTIVYRIATVGVVHYYIRRYRPA
jgi:O-antigen/teichoic acid export membrane protein